MRLPKRMLPRHAALIALAATAPFAQGGLGATTNLDARLLAQHNRERAALGIPALRWSPALAADAAAWADELAARGVMDHYDGPDADEQGENLSIGTTGAFTVEKLAELWIDEKSHFVPGTFPANSRTGRWEDVSHYTQLIWSDSRELGCAMATGKEADFLVCRYSSAGNVEGERVY